MGREGRDGVKHIQECLRKRVEGFDLGGVQEGETLEAFLGAGTL